MRTWTLAALLAAMTAAPAAAQETPPDTTAYKGAAVPVWVVVEDVEGEAGAHRVYASIEWDDYRSTLRFATEILAGDLVVLLPRGEGEDADLSDSCAFASALMAHGSKDSEPMDRADAECLAPPAEYLPFIGAEHLGAPLACKEAKPEDGTEDPRIRYYGCYWAQKPGGG